MVCEKRKGFDSLKSRLLHLGTIPEFIAQLLNMHNLQSSHAFKYPPSCFNVFMTPLKI